MTNFVHCQTDGALFWVLELNLQLEREMKETEVAWVGNKIPLLSCYHYFS